MNFVAGTTKTTKTVHVARSQDWAIAQPTLCLENVTSPRPGVRRDVSHQRELGHGKTPFEALQNTVSAPNYKTYCKTCAKIAGFKI